MTMNDKDEANLYKNLLESTIAITLELNWQTKACAMGTMGAGSDLAIRQLDKCVTRTMPYCDRTRPK